MALTHEAYAFLETLGFIEVYDGTYRFIRCRNNDERLKVLLDLWRNRYKDAMSADDRYIVSECITQLWGQRSWGAKQNSRNTMRASGRGNATASASLVRQR